MKSIRVLDCGGQYAHLIASRLRRGGVFSEVNPAETPAHHLEDAAGIIISGGPDSVYEADSPQLDREILELRRPVLGICYGLQWIVRALGGEVRPGKAGEYGRISLKISGPPSPLLKSCGHRCNVWMSHGDEAIRLPRGFTVIARSANCQHAAIADSSRHIYGLQFHPEVSHTEHGEQILQEFAKLCGANSWSVERHTSRLMADLKTQVKDRRVFMLVSGGVDSTVAFTLLNRVLGPERVYGLYIDTGLMRHEESQQIRRALTRLGVRNFEVVEASEDFLSGLVDVYDPQKKRRLIGDTFIAVQERESERLGLSVTNGWMVGQGTIYPDTIESGGTRRSAQIKLHHNRSPAVERLLRSGLVVEPLRDLYKDEVRQLGRMLGLPASLVERHPFPGPGLGVRILCAKQPDYLEGPTFVLSVPAVILPIRSVGVQGDGRTYRHAVALFSREQYHLTEQDRHLASALPNTSPEINRVVRCLSHSQPPELEFSPGYVTRDRVELLRQADRIVHVEMSAAQLHEKIWQFPVVLLPFGTQPGGQSIVLRPVESIDAMTANVPDLSSEFLWRVTQRLLHLGGINMVFLDLTSKPPGTIEWE